MSGIPWEYVTETCRVGQGAECCAFLTNTGEWACAKDEPRMAGIIESRLARGELTAQGDNCPGFATVVPE